MSLLTGKQCKTARLLLKWNFRELAFRSNIKPNQIELFERGTKQLFASQKDQMAKAFKKEGIQFLDFGEVRLIEGGGSESAHGTMQQQQQVYSVDEETLRDMMEDSGAYGRSRRAGFDAEPTASPTVD